MKKIAIITINVSSLIIIASVTNATDALTAFFIAGIVPGTAYSLSPAAMFSLFMLLSIALVATSFRLSSAETTEKILPRKRYGRL